MPEVAYAGQDHGQPLFIGGRDYLVVAHGPAGLDNSSGPGLCRR